MRIFFYSVIISLLLINSSPILAAGAIGIAVMEKRNSYTPQEELFANYLNEHSNSGLKFQAINAKSRESIIEGIKAKTLHIYLADPLSSIYINTQTGCKLALKQWLGGIAKEHAVIFVHKNRPYLTIKDLKGTKIAFASKTSYAGYFLPKSLILASHSSIKAVTQTARNLGKETRYYVTKSSVDVLSQVNGGIAEAGVLDQLSYDMMVDNFSNIRLLANTFSLPREVLNICEMPKQENIIKTFKQLKISKAGRELLSELRSSHFDRISHYDKEVMRQYYPYIMQAFESE